MALDKRPKRSADASAGDSRKKAKTATEPTAPRAVPSFSSNLASEETDFPRGGGTSLTAFELKQVRDEGRREADAEAAAEASTKPKKKWQDSEREKRRAAKNKVVKKDVDPDLIRVDQLNYKRLVPGTHMLVRIHSILPLHLIVSLPNNLLGYVPITEISSTLTALLKADEEAGSEVDEDEEEGGGAPDLDELFNPGQYFPARITATFPTASASFVSQYPPSETIRLASRVELTLVPEKVNAEVDIKDVEKGYLLVGEIKDEEDKGWRVGLGLQREETSTAVEGWIPHSAAKGQQAGLKRGGLVMATILSQTAGGRVLNLSLDGEVAKSSQLAEVSTVGSILPGHQVAAIVTAVTDSGLNVKIGGFYDGTIDLAHLNLGEKTVEQKYSLGKKIRARVLYDNLSVTPRRFGLSVLPHILNVGSSIAADGKTPLEHAIAMGTKIDAVTVTRVIPEWGLVCRTKDGLDGFVHISHIADQRIPALSHGTGEYSVGTTHAARVIGHSPLDGVLLLSTEKSVIDRVFTNVDELVVGQQLKGKIKRLSDSSLFVDVGGSVDGIVWPIHYADIRLKHPEKRFRPGNTVRARVFALEPARNRVVLTLKKTLIDSTKPTPSSLSDVAVGQVLDGVVSRITDSGCMVDLFGGVRAFVPIAEVSETYIANVSSVVFVGQPVAVRIINLRPGNDTPVASIKQAAAGAVEAAAFEGKVGDVVSGKVKEIHQDQVVVSLTPSGATALLSLSNLSNHRHMGIEELRSALHEGDALDELVVVAKNDATGLIIVSNKARKEPKTAPQKSGVSTSAATLDSVKVGSILSGRVISVNTKGAMVQLDNGLKGKLHPHDMVDDLDTSAALDTGSEVQCYVLAVHKSTRSIDLSTRASRVGGSKKTKVVDPEVDGVASLTVGQAVRGVVKNISGGGVFVTLGRNVDARIKIGELFDEYVKAWEERFEIGQVVKGKILSIDPKRGLVEMTLKTQDRPQKSKVSGLGDYEVGQKVDAEVKSVEAYGVFLQIQGSNVRGLCHKSEISDQKVKSVEKLLRRFREGDSVKAKVLAIDKDKGRINFGIKPSYFTSEDINGDEAMDGEDDDEEEEDGEDEDEEEEGDEEEEEEEEEGDEDEGDEEEDGEESDDEIVLDQPSASAPSNSSKPKPKAARPAAALQLSTGFNWSARSPSPAPSNEDSASDSEDAAPAPTSKSKAKGKQTFDLTGSAPDAQPSSTAEFERALLSSPNSSFLWIQYMSFLLQLHEIDAARKIGRKALEKIAYREETEKLNVWMALVNLEIGFGTEKEADKVWKEAAQYNDARTVYLRYAEALAAAGKDQLVEEVYQKTIKKFSQHIDSWTKLAEYYLKKGDTDAARALLPRAMQSLEGSKHVEMIQRMAVLEFKHGDPERGKTLFEGLMDRYKKRLDLWSVYIDQVAKTGDIGVVRGLVERALDQHLTSKKAKFLFKKWLSLETRIGDAAGQEKAKERARDWVLQNAKPVEGEGDGSDDDEEDG